jgi:hypothetical protein
MQVVVERSDSEVAPGSHLVSSALHSLHLRFANSTPGHEWRGGDRAAQAHEMNPFRDVLRVGIRVGRGAASMKPFPKPCLESSVPYGVPHIFVVIPRNEAEDPAVSESGEDVMGSFELLLETEVGQVARENDMVHILLVEIREQLFAYPEGMGIASKGEEVDCAGRSLVEEHFGPGPVAFAGDVEIGDVGNARHHVLGVGASEDTASSDSPPPFPVDASDLLQSLGHSC